MHNYIYELLQAPAPADEWAKVWEYHKHPGTFPIANIVEDAEDRSGVIVRFGAWLKENRASWTARRLPLTLKLRTAILRAGLPPSSRL